jgi:hypothetical protein
MLLTILQIIRLTHTLIWALFAGSILAIPVLAWLEQWNLVGILILFVLFECVILALNHMRCPLTSLAARYTDDRTDNFDIYLPLWLAKHNKTIFGSMFVAGLLFSLLRWMR